MTLRIESAFRATSLTIALNDTSSAVASIADGLYSHTYIGAVATSYSLFATAVKAALDAASTLTQAYTVSWSGSNLQYTISAPSAFTLGASTALGFSATTGSGTSHTSDVTPYFAIASSLGYRRPEDEGFEPDDIVRGAELEDGTPYNTAQTAVLKRHKFAIEYEPRAAVHSKHAAAAAPWTWEHFITQNRGTHPFVMADDEETAL